MRRLSVALIGGIAMLSACAPVENQRGYVPDMEAVSSIQVGMDTKDTVSKKLGDASTQATFSNDTWYYISAHVEHRRWLSLRPARPCGLNQTLHRSEQGRPQLSLSATRHRRYWAQHLFRHA